MNKKSSSMVNMPAPREPINQKIDTNNALVLNHNAIYEQRLAEITQSNTCDKAIVTVNPYGTAPLSLYLGFGWMKLPRLRSMLLIAKRRQRQCVINMMYIRALTLFLCVGWYPR
ncbi:arylsulfatase [Salmonella enterica subsp. enterica]|uniref:Arylsulfatase n=1 Tax=Salmonella enterica I TaxID=59201 RepID=A0A3S4HFS9_SALET|nr:arylsulfatase [Salmonella enterica subsp. enterica]